MNFDFVITRNDGICFIDIKVFNFQLGNQSNLDPVGVSYK